MSLGLIEQSFDLCENELNELSERLRRNWLQKLNKFNTTDDSLTSLAWLYDMHPIGMELDTTQKFTELNVGQNVAGSNTFCNQQQPFAGSLLDPQVRFDYRTKWTGKPPFSYATLICLAMRELGKPKVTLSDIYGWIMNNFAYYRHTDSSWQNSVRHNLSLNKCFEKVPRDKNERGKGGFWRVSPKHVDWLEANLAKCRRAAPPPGPPPPIPRSMLIQQQLLQRPNPSQQHLMSAGNNYNLYSALVTASQTQQPETGNCFSGMIKKPLTTELSPRSGSSTSSVSSSPNSLGSALSPVGYDAQKSHLNRLPPISLPQLKIDQPLTSSPNSVLSVSGFRPTRDANETTSAGAKCPQLGAPVRRRKSSVHRQNNIEEPDFGNFEDDLPRLCDNKPDKHDQYEGRRGTPFHERTTMTRGMNPAKCEHTNCRRFCYGLTHQVRKTLPTRSAEHGYVRREGSEKSKPTSAHRLIGLRRPSDEKQLKLENYRLKDRQRTHRRQTGTEIRVMPTRILPPRRRFSKWTFPRAPFNRCCANEGDESYRSKDKDPHTLVSRNQRGVKSRRQCLEQMLDEKEKSWTESDVSLPLVGTTDDEDAACIWPPLSNPDREMACRRLATHQPTEHSYQGNLMWNSPNKNVLARPAWPTPQYCSKALSPIRRGFNSNQANSLSITSGSDRSSVSLYESNGCSDGHIYHTLPPSRHSTPRRVETQACKQLFPSKPSDASVHFGRLYPTSGEAECYLGSSPDRFRMPRWAAVFLPDGESNQVVQSHIIDQPAMHGSVGLYGQMDSVTEYVHTSYPSSIYATSTMNNAITSVRPCGPEEQNVLGGSDSGLEKQSELTTSEAQFTTSDSPLLEGLDIGSARFDFDTLDNLVEASGPIPLDLDLGLTASLNGTYSSLSNDSAIGSSRDSTVANGQSGDLLSPMCWSSSPSVSQELLSLPWFTESHSAQAADYLFSMFDNDEMDCNKSGQSNANDGRLSTPPLQERYGA
ncbi:unnamed protein product [Dicrocoelium dendriticum]|nr:unnamed protein product [Dicrocoelium dendriticum]